MTISATSIGDALFTKTQQKVLGLLFGNPDQRFFTNEIMRLIGMGRGTVSRELERLVSACILTITREGNQNYYQANVNSPVFREIMGIVQKTFCVTDAFRVAPSDDNDHILIAGVHTVSRAALKKLVARYQIHRLELFGSAARGELKADSDIDLLVEFEKGKSPSLGGMVKLQEDLSTLLGGRGVDVATPSILNNPYRRQAIKKDLELIHAA